MWPYLKDCNVNETDDRDIIYVVIYDNGEAYPEDHFSCVEAVFDDHNSVKTFMDNKNANNGYQLTKNKRETFGHCCDSNVLYMKVMQEEWYSDAEADYYDSVGYYIVRTFNKVTGYELFDIVEVAKIDE